MHLFYTPDISSEIYTLNAVESNHCIRVLRLGIGDKIQLIDGKGGFYEAEITEANHKHCTVSVINTVKEMGKRNYNLHLAIAPTKSMDRLEWFVEKATEVGIEEISLINCRNNERTIVKTDRLLKIAIAAIKQSIKAYLPKINEPLDFKKFISSVKDFKGEKLIAHCHSAIISTSSKFDTNSFSEGKNTISHFLPPQQNALILIGPEGDFTIEEVKLALDNGFREISLGNSRLRTETAALYACMAVTIIN